MTKRTARKFFISFMLLAGVYALVVAAAYITQTNIIFQSLGASVSPPKSYKIEEITFTTSDDVNLYGWWLNTPGAIRTILYCQGNGRNFSSHTQRLKTFTRLGCNALLFDYRGYGKSQGKIKRESDIYLDADAAWEYLTMTRNIVDGDIIKRIQGFQGARAQV
jgi:uncharacterized protein